MPKEKLPSSNFSSAVLFGGMFYCRRGSERLWGGCQRYRHDIRRRAAICARAIGEFSLPELPFQPAAVGTNENAVAVRQVIFPFAFIAFAIFMGHAARPVQLAVSPLPFETVLLVVDQHALAFKAAAGHAALIAPAIVPPHDDMAVLGHAA